jgi:penicillin-binding protein 2
MMKRDFRDSKDFKDYYEERRLGFRLAALQWMLTAVILMLGGRLWYLQVSEGEYYRELSEKNHFRLVQITPLRGTLRDREGKELAANRVSWNLYLNRERTPNPDEILPLVAEILSMDGKLLEERLSQSRVRPVFEPVLLKEDVGLAEAAFFEARRTEFPALNIRTEALRSYPEGDLASHLIGYVGEASETDMESEFEADVRLGDIVGKAGLERTFDTALSGRRGFKKVLVNSLGREIADLQTVHRPQNGRDLTLAIDYEMQKDLETAFAGRSGSAVFLDPETGEVLALTSQPSFNPNLFASRFSRESWLALVSDPRHPLQNRAVQSRFSPGSAFKVVMAVAALEEGVATPRRTETCLGSTVVYGKRFHCHKEGGHGTVDLREAIVRSCNVYFYRLGQELGIEKIAEWSRRLGFGGPTGIDLPQEEPGIVPDPEWKRRRLGQPWYPGETISVSIGQGALTVTPVQMARFIAGIANGGTLRVPRLLKYRDGAAEESRTAAGTGSIERMPIAPRTVEFLREAMWGVVNDNGTGWRARIEGRDVAGKTGTAQVTRLSTGVDSEDLPVDLRSHSWFVGFAPAGGARIAFAVFVEHGGHGGESAAPIAGHVLEGFFSRSEPGEEGEDVRTAHLDGS